MTPFWRNWLLLWCMAVILFGIVLAGAAFEASSGPARAAFTLIGRPLPEMPDSLHRFLLALIGAVTIGWGLTLLAAIRTAAAPSRPLWVGLTVAVLVWYVVDSLLSVVTGFPLNAVSNTVLLAGFLLPVLAARLLRA